MKYIADIDNDFAQWYTDVVKKSELIDYSSIRGCIVMRPYGYKIWELIRENLDKEIKNTGHENVYMPTFISESLLQKEKDHVNGFAPEVAWVTHGGDEELAERLCVRPTSETLFCEHYAKIINSYRDLPKLYNQWCSVVRWEKTTRPFLRNIEFLWQEGHTAHANFYEAEEEAKKMIDVYEKFCENILAIPVIKGKKTEKEKFAGAVKTYTIESMMHDGRALQTGTTHNFGDNFAKVFNIKYLDKDNNLKFVYQSSWGMSTRLIGALIMVHGDNNGLVLPPKIAPIQVVIIPIKINSSIQKFILELEKKLLEKNIRVKIDLSDKTPGWKFSESEMRGVPIRIEVGPKDIENNSLCVVRRDTREKNNIKINDFNIEKVLMEIQVNLFNRAKKKLLSNIFEIDSYNELKSLLNDKLCFAKINWCGNQICETKIKEETGATIRCIELNIENIENNSCIYCGNKAKYKVYCAKAY